VLIGSEDTTVYCIWLTEQRCTLRYFLYFSITIFGRQYRLQSIQFWTLFSYILFLVNFRVELKFLTQKILCKATIIFVINSVVDWMPSFLCKWVGIKSFWNSATGDMRSLEIGVFFNICRESTHRWLTTFFYFIA
jgi:hypothetical protein